MLEMLLLAFLSFAAGPWDQIAITFPGYNSLPARRVDAASGGWLQDADCSGAKFNRYYKQVGLQMLVECCRGRWHARRR